MNKSVDGEFRRVDTRHMEALIAYMLNLHCDTAVKSDLIKDIVFLSLSLFGEAVVAGTARGVYAFTAKQRLAFFLTEVSDLLRLSDIDKFVGLAMAAFSTFSDFDDEIGVQEMADALKRRKTKQDERRSRAH